ncbi:MAG: GlsB/YeaQ/YmgE family stress response membrane protein [Brumimicrobium sp.]
MGILIAVIIGAVAGWLAGLIMKSNTGGLLFNIILGIVGGFVGNWLFRELNVSTESSFLGELITATVGAVILILIARILFGGKKRKR